MASSRKKLLLACGSVPGLNRGGAATRSAMLLESAAADYEVYVLVAPLEKVPAPVGPLPKSIRGRVVALEVLPLLANEDPAIETILDLRDHAMGPDAMVALFRARMNAARSRPDHSRESDTPFMCNLTMRAMARNKTPFADVQFDVVLIMSIQLLPLAFRYLESASPPTCILDLVDVESQKHQRFSEIHSRNGAAALAQMTAQEAIKLAAFEQRHVARFDLVLACSDLDRRDVLQRIPGCNVRVVPNAVPEPDAGDYGPAAPETDFLFVGTLGYFPNADGIIFFCREILHEIGSRIGRAPALRVISHAIPKQLMGLEEIPGVTMVTGVEALGPHYASARAAIVPLRAGSGTRLKILEAFSYRTPVVSTRLGAEGIDAVDGRHLLIADAPHEFATACRRLLEDGESRRAIADAALDLVRSTYTFAVVIPALREILAALPEQG